MVKYVELLLWANLPEKYKTATLPNSFKTKFETWQCKKCAFRLYQAYHQNFGFLQLLFPKFYPISAHVALLYPLTRSPEIIKDFDIFVKSESKLDSVFPNAQLKVTGTKFFRYD